MMIGRSVPRLDVKIEATNLRAGPEAHVSLEGDIDRKPARGSLHIARPAAGGAILDGVDIAIGSVVAQGGAVFDPANFAAGQFTLRARDLDDLSALALQKLSGTLDADVTFTHADARQDVSIKADAKRIEGFGVGLDRLAANLALSDVYRRPALEGSLTADQARLGGETISKIRLDAKGGAEASDISFAASAMGFGLDARGKLIRSDPVRLEIAKFDAARGRDRIGLAGPATIIIRDGGADLRNIAFKLGGGRLTLEGRAGNQLDLKTTARAVPLSVLDIVSPGLGLSGSLDGEAAINGAVFDPAGTYRFKISNLASTHAALPPAAIDASGKFGSGRTALEAMLTAGQAGRLKVSGSAPLDGAGPLDLTIRGNLDAGLFNRSLSASGRRFSGSIMVDAGVRGTVQQPQASGSIALANGSFQDAILGVRLDAIRARLVAQGDRINIESASATALNGGAITASGSLRLDPAGGFPGEIRIRGENAELVQSALATAVLGLDIDVSGPLAKSPRIGGAVDIRILDIAIPERLAAQLQPLPDTRHIDPPPAAAARLAIAAKNKRDRDSPALDAALDLAIRVPGRIRVRGRGLDAQLGGNVRLTGTIANPRPVGSFNLVSGRLRVLTADLEITRANLAFAGDLSPQLDFVATTQAGGASVSIAISGDPADPQFTFTSSPDLPQDEILSRLLFGAPSGQLSPTQALSLAQAMAIYSGGNSAFEGLRRSLGLGAAANSNNPLNNFLGDRVSLGVHTGATPAQTGVGMSVRIFKQLKAKGTIDATGGASVGVGAEHEW
jgi:translocation and assembly module TamB